MVRKSGGSFYRLSHSINYLKNLLFEYGPKVDFEGHRLVNNSKTNHYNASIANDRNYLMKESEATNLLFDPTSHTSNASLRTPNPPASAFLFSNRLSFENPIIWCVVFLIFSLALFFNMSTTGNFQVSPVTSCFFSIENAAFKEV